MKTEAMSIEQPEAQLLDRPHVHYLAIAFGWSWTLWIGAWLLGRFLDVGEVLFNESIVWRVVFVRDASSDVVLVSLIALTAVFGPMIAGILSSRRDPLISKGGLSARLRRVDVGWGPYQTMLALLVFVTLPTLMITLLSVDRSTDGPTLGQLLPFLGLFFVYQVLTSATEEIGWRGYLVEKLLPGRSFWDVGWSLGFVWAAWHYPVVVIMFAQQGMGLVQIVGSLAGFTMGIVAMSIVHTWFYDQTRSVFLNMVIHAVFNTVPLTMVLLWEGSPAALLSNLLLWAAVFYLRKREGVDAAA
jgi:membrane protease YdiL (CAAX protease family)